MTYIDIIKIFKVFASQHPMLRTFSWGNLSDYSRDTYITEYPAIHFVPQPSTIDNTLTSYNFTCLIYDKLNEYTGEPELSNQLDSLSLTQQILNDFIDTFINQLTQYGFYLQMPVQYAPFNDRFKESVVGIEATITIQVEQTSCIPPYIEDATPLADMVARHEPHSALFAGPDGLRDYRILLKTLEKLLKTTGIAVFEIGFNQSKSVANLGTEAGFTSELTHDLSGNPRVLRFSLGIAQPNR
jgi:hypothetical protein